MNRTLLAAAAAFVAGVAATFALGGLITQKSLSDAAALLSNAPVQTAQSPAPFKQPTATEYWQLQGECVKLAQNMLDRLGGTTGDKYTDHGFGPLQRSANSHYRADDGRCYVIISESDLVPRKTDVNGKAIKDAGNYNNLTKILYDGQTGDLLADARTTFDKETANICDVRYPQTDSNGGQFTSSKPLAYWDETVSYIESKLGD